MGLNARQRSIYDQICQNGPVTMSVTGTSRLFWRCKETATVKYCGFQLTDIEELLGLGYLEPCPERFRPSWKPKIKTCPCPGFPDEHRPDCHCHHHHHPQPKPCCDPAKVLEAITKGIRDIVTREVEHCHNEIVFAKDIERRECELAKKVVELACCKDEDESAGHGFIPYRDHDHANPKYAKDDDDE